MSSKNKHVFLRLFCDLRIFRAKVIDVRIFGELLVEEDLVWECLNAKSTILIYPTSTLFVLTSYIFRFIGITFYFSCKKLNLGGGGMSQVLN